MTPDAPSNTLVVGMTGAGKTTFAISYLLNARPACRFLFDDFGRFSRRLRVRPVPAAVTEALPHSPIQIGGFEFGSSMATASRRVSQRPDEA
jgi:GTPase SAR1 family protein